MKKFVQAIVAVVLCIMLSAAGFAETGAAFSMQNLSIQDNCSIQIQFYSALDEKLEASNLALKLGNTDLGIESVFRYSSTGNGTSWLFLVDTASVSTRSGAEPIRALLDALIGQMGANDNAAILSTGETLESIELVENADTLKKMIDSLQMNKEVTALNSTIRDALAFLKTNQEVCPRTCLVIISDGETNDESDVTLQTLQAEIKKSEATIYTVAFVGKKANKEKIESFGSLARCSKGGMEIQAESKADAVAGIIDGMKKNEQGFHMLTSAEIPDGTVGSEITLSLKNTAYQAVYTLSASEQLRLTMSRPTDTATEEPALTEEPAPEPVDEETPAPTDDPAAVITQTPSDDPATEPESEPEPELDILTIALAALGVVVVLGVVVIIIAVKKNKRRKEEANVIQNDSDGPPDDPIPKDEDLRVMDYAARSEKIRVTLMRIGVERSEYYSAEMTTELLAGRDRNSVKLILPEDDLKISGTHLVLRFIQGSMFVEDLSRNGTFVNDTRIQRPTKLHQNDILGAGASRFRVIWEMKK